MPVSWRRPGSRGESRNRTHDSDDKEEVKERISSQGAQNPFIIESILNHVRDPHMMSSIFLNQGTLLGSVGSSSRDRLKHFHLHSVDLITLAAVRQAYSVTIPEGPAMVPVWN